MLIKRIIRTSSRIVTAIGLCTAAAQIAASQGLGAPPAITKPPDGSGIKWSTVALAGPSVDLANGETITKPSYWNPYPGFLPGPFFAQYNVQLEQQKNTAISVWVLLKDPPAGAPEAVKSKWGDIKYWCHGLTFGGANVYSPPGNVVPSILAAGWTAQNACPAKPAKGDIIVYTATKKTQEAAKGSVVHTALANGDDKGTYSSKDRYLPLVAAQTKAAMDAQYGPKTSLPATGTCYPPKPAPEVAPTTLEVASSFGAIQQAEFYPLQINPELSFGELVGNVGSQEAMYVIPEPLIQVSDIQDVEILPELDNGAPQSLFRVEITLTSLGRTNLETFIANTTPDHPIALIWQSAVFYVYPAFALDTYPARFVVAGNLPYDLATELSQALGH